MSHNAFIFHSFIKLHEELWAQAYVSHMTSTPIVGLLKHSWGDFLTLQLQLGFCLTSIQIFPNFYACNPNVPVPNPQSANFLGQVLSHMLLYFASASL